MPSQSPSRVGSVGNQIGRIICLTCDRLQKSIPRRVIQERTWLASLWNSNGPGFKRAESVHDTGASGARVSRMLIRHDRPVIGSPQPEQRPAMFSVMIVGIRTPYSSIAAGS
jgi:hypothetical protein